MKRQHILLFLVSALTLVASGVFIACRKAAESPAPAAIVNLKIGYIPIVDCSQIYVASRLGHFAENGITVELVPLAGGPAIIQALASNAIDVGFANLTTVVFYEQNSPPLKRLAGGTRMDKNHSEAGLIVLGESGIERIADLKGKSVAVNSRRNIVDLAVLRSIRSSGLSHKNITLVEVPFKDMEAAVRSRKVDAAALAEPFLSSALSKPGLQNLGDHFAIAFNSVYSTGYFAMPKSSTVTAEIAKRFETAISKATKDLTPPTDKAIEAIAESTKLSREIIKSAGKPEFVVTISESAFSQMKTWLEEEGLLGK